MRELAGRDSKYRKYGTEGTARSARAREYTSEILCDGWRQNGQPTEIRNRESESDSHQQRTASRTQRLLRFDNAIEIDKLSTARVFIHILIAPSSFSNSSYIVTSARVITQFVIVVIAKAHTYIYGTYIYSTFCAVQVRRADENGGTDADTEDSEGDGEEAEEAAKDE